jgi:hypothetical protein
LHEHGFKNLTLKMGEIIDKSGVPRWAWSVILTAFLGLMSFTIGASAGNQKIKDNIESNRETIQRDYIELKNELDTKASKEKVDLTYEAVIRIEGKLDEHVKHD